MQQLIRIFLLSSLFFVFFHNTILGQECGTLPTPDSVMSKNPWKGNNKFLLGVLKQSGYDLPSDYFDKVDSKGFYNGKVLKLDDHKQKIDTVRDKGSTGGKTNLIIGGQTVRYIRVRAFIHQDGSGNGFTEAEVRAHFEYVNQLYRNNNVPIIFYVLCDDITVIPSSNFYNVADLINLGAMFVSYGYGSFAYSAHFCNSLPGSSSGIAISAPGAALAISKSAGSATLAHELGHCLGLQHTHNGTFPCAEEGNEDCADCWQEPVSRTMTQPAWCLVNIGKKKCEVYGDQLADTPGEPRLTPAITSSCTINWSLTDPTDNWNAQWTPQQFNVMSYAKYSPSIDCRSLFTAGQIAVMLYYVPSYATTSDFYSISGSSALCVNQSTTYSVPSLSGVSSYTWQVTGGTILSGQGTNQISVSFSIGGFQNVTVTPNCGYPWSRKAVNILNQLQILGQTSVLTNATVQYTTILALDHLTHGLLPQVGA